MSTINASCLMCGKKYEIMEDHQEFKKLVEQAKELPTFVCDLCNNKVRFESEDKKKMPKSN